MELYKQSDAVLLKDSFKKYIGKEFFYEVGKSSVLKRIRVSVIGRIACGAELTNGCEIKMVFANASALSPVAFTSLNDLVLEFPYQKKLHDESKKPTL